MALRLHLRRAEVEMLLIRLVVLLLLAPAAQAREVADITIVSAFSDGGEIPAEYTCEGRGWSPPLSWSALPPNTRSVVVLVEDLDGPRGPFEHLVLFNLSPNVRSLASQAAAPTVGVSARNDAARLGFAPLCPASGSHRYRFSVLALDVMLPLAAGDTFGQVSDALRGHVLAHGELTGRYPRR